MVWNVMDIEIEYNGVDIVSCSVHISWILMDFLLEEGFGKEEYFLLVFLINDKMNIILQLRTKYNLTVYLNNKFFRSYHYTIFDLYLNFHIPKKPFQEHNSDWLYHTHIDNLLAKSRLVLGICVCFIDIFINWHDWKDWFYLLL